MVVLVIRVLQTVLMLVVTGVVRQAGFFVLRRILTAVLKWVVSEASRGSPVPQQQLA